MQACCADSANQVPTDEGTRTRCQVCGTFACCAKEDFYTRPEDQRYEQNDDGSLKLDDENKPIQRTDVIVYRCRECRRRHIRVVIDPGVIGITGARVGG